MAVSECPNCHCKTSFAAKCPYCPECGWNRDAALVSVRRGFKIIPMSLLGFAGSMVAVVAMTGQKTKGPFNPGFLFPFFVITPVAFVFAYFTLRRKLAELTALRPPTVTGGGAIAMGGPSGFASGSVRNATAIEPSAQVQALLRTSRPREVQVSTRGKFGIATVVLVEMVFGAIFGVHLYGLWAQAASFASFKPADWAILALSTLLVWIPFGMWYQKKKECDLLENGEIATASVVKQWSAAKGNSTIEYVFKDLRGQMQERTGFDYTGKVAEGTTIAVFYDSENPKRQIPYCGSFHEVIF